MKTVRILSIDGGGIRGLIPATILANWEERLGAPIASKFHMVAGTSTGGILATALCKPGTPAPATDLVKLYRDKGPSIFGSSSLLSLGGLTGELYSPVELQKAIDAVIQGNLSDVEKDLLITAYDMEDRSPRLFKSWAARGYDSSAVPSENNFQLKDVCRATSAAPTFFPPAHFTNEEGKMFTFVDGGVYANNPAMCALVAARRLYPLADEYIVVSLGTGALIKPYPYDEFKSAGLATWARPLLDIMFQGVDATTEYQLTQLAPQVLQYRFQTQLVNAKESMDDVSAANLTALGKDALNTLASKSKDVATVLSRLSEPLASRESLGYPKQGTVAKPVAEVRKEANKPFVGAATGAAIGTAVAPGIGTVVGGFLGWLFSKPKTEEKKV